MSKTGCSVREGRSTCGQSVVARGMCNRHYQRWRRTGRCGPVGGVRGDELPRRKLRDEAWELLSHIKGRSLSVSPHGRGLIKVGFGGYIFGRPCLTSLLRRGLARQFRNGTVKLTRAGTKLLKEGR